MDIKFTLRKIKIPEGCQVSFINGKVSDATCCEFPAIRKHTNTDDEKWLICDNCHKCCSDRS